MRRLSKVLSGAIFGLAMLIIPEFVKGDCSSCNGFLDNGVCNKDDINNKFCGIGGMPKDCYTGGCSGGGY